MDFQACVSTFPGLVLPSLEANLSHIRGGRNESLARRELLELEDRFGKKCEPGYCDRYIIHPPPQIAPPATRMVPTIRIHLPTKESPGELRPAEESSEKRMRA